MPRLIRREPLLKRLQDRFDPYDFLLQLAETLNDDSYDELLHTWSVPMGMGCNILFIIARLAGKPSIRGGDDVFGDHEGKSGSGWFPWMAALVIPLLATGCCLNTLFTFFRKRQYRLFEQPVEEAPATPSAQLVRVDSSPTSSPLQYLQRVIKSAASGARAHADPEREVWEVAVWDPKPFNLTLFTFFSPGHLALYYAMLPPSPTDANPMVKVVLAFFFGALLSFQLSLLRTCFSQQSKDSALIHGEVMNEYDTKFVHPMLNRPVRDVGIQTRESATTPRGTRTREVDIYTPTTIIKRGFKTNPNPNYARQYDPDNLSSIPSDYSKRTSDVGIQRSTTTPSLITPSNPYARSNGYTNPTYSNASTGGPDYSSPLKPHHSRLHDRSSTNGRDGDGGNLGVYSHAASPLRKAVSSSYLSAREGGRQGSPLKRVSTPAGGAGGTGGSGSSGGLAAGGRRRETGRF